MTQPGIRFNGFSDEWVEKTLGEMVIYHQPGKYIVESTDYKNEGTPVLTAGKTFILGYTDESIGIYKNSSNGVILFDDFTTSSKFVNFDFKVKSSAIKILTNDDQVTDLKFLFETISLLEKTPDNHQRQWISSFSKQLINTPTLPEQQKIGSLFSKYDAIIALREQKLEELNALKKGLLQQMFDDGVGDEHTPQVRFSGFNDEWVGKTLGDVSNLMQGAAWKSSEYLETGPNLLITISNLKSAIVDTSFGNRLAEVSLDLQNKYGIANNDVLVSMTGNVGRVSIYKDCIGAPKALLNQRVGKVIPVNIDNLFLYVILRNELFERKMIDKGQGAAQLNISSKDIQQFPIQLPTLPEQQKIGQLFEKLDARISNEQDKIEQLKAQKQGLLQRML